VKSFFWRGSSYESLNKYESALRDMQMAVGLDPSNEQATKAVRFVPFFFFASSFLSSVKFLLLLFHSFLPSLLPLFVCFLVFSFLVFVPL
jgi:hypothetical protein